jgi:predicted nucleic acid-binding protein
VSRFLFDTTAFIDYLRHNDQAAVSYVEAVIDGSQHGYCSVITEAELWPGVRSRREELEVTTLLANLKLYP